MNYKDYTDASLMRHEWKTCDRMALEWLCHC